MYLVFAYLAAVNLVTVIMFGLDQLQARGGQKRIPPATLLLMSLIGGWPGAKLAQHIFKHCPTTRSFYRFLNGIPVVWMAFVCALLAVSTFAPQAFVPQMNAPQVAESAEVQRETPKFFMSAKN